MNTEKSPTERATFVFVKFFTEIETIFYCTHLTENPKVLGFIM